MLNFELRHYLNLGLTLSALGVGLAVAGCNQQRYQPAQWRAVSETETDQAAKHGTTLPGTTLPGTTLPRRYSGSTLPGTTLPGTTLPGEYLPRPWQQQPTGGTTLPR